ncbi:MAG: hypothetical protein CV045_10650 [Cyanobacteria bacterium M5B4]|nr:MAG: hypothetical protein CV045_10650 [Cyanobacteria bacterium M5B4]
MAEAQMAIVELAKQCVKYDKSGIDIYFATNPPQRKEGGNVADLAKVFQVKDAPPADDLLSSLQDALNRHFDNPEEGKKETIIVVLDHLPNDQEGIINVLVEATKKIDTENDAYRLGISFILIGENEEAKAFLNFLDDELEVAGASHDMIDAKDWMAIKAKQSSIEKFLLDALLD